MTVLLIIMDGFGLRDEIVGNAIAQAKTPNLDRLFSHYPFSKLKASGEAVGLPRGFMGNSEVGHLNIGAGRIVLQDIMRIYRAIDDRTFFTEHALMNAIRHVQHHGSDMHIMGLFNDAGVHSHNDHLFALLELMKQHKIKNIYLHAITDGRDTPPKSAKKYLVVVDKRIKAIRSPAKIATVMGRYFAMDRDNRWDREELAYKALTTREGYNAKDHMEALEKAYARSETDEFVTPTVCLEKEGAVGPHDALIFFNFRPDRAREITHAFLDKEFTQFPRKKVPDLYYVCMTHYDRDLKGPVVFPDMKIKNTLSEVLAQNGKRQFHIAETEKYAHVTYFLNGLKEDKVDKEDREIIPSPKVATYDKTPEMSADLITEKLLKELNNHDFCVVNLANCDMVGHTGSIPATVKAVETVDKCVGMLVEANKKNITLITADHGNAEEMLDSKGDILTAHTTNLVPFCLVSEHHRHCTLKDGKLGDIAPTILQLMKISIPQEMTGEVLVKCPKLQGLKKKFSRKK